MKQMKLWMIPCMIIAVVTTVYVEDSSAGGCCTLPSRSTNVDWEGTKAPDVAFQDLDGKTVRLSEHRDRVVIATFWSSDSEPSLSPLTRFGELVAKYKDKPVQVVGIIIPPKTISDGWQATLKHLAQTQKISSPVLVGDATAAGAYGVDGSPATFLIDQQGVIVKRYDGEPGRKTLEQYLSKLL